MQNHVYLALRELTSPKLDKKPAYLVILDTMPKAQEIRNVLFVHMEQLPRVADKEDVELVPQVNLQ